MSFFTIAPLHYRYLNELFIRCALRIGTFWDVSRHANDGNEQHRTGRAAFTTGLGCGSIAYVSSPGNGNALSDTDANAYANAVYRGSNAANGSDADAALRHAAAERSASDVHGHVTARHNNRASDAAAAAAAAAAGFYATHDAARGSFNSNVDTVIDGGGGGPVAVDVRPAPSSFNEPAYGCRCRNAAASISPA